MDELIKHTSIRLLKTTVLLGMWHEYVAALRSLPTGDPSNDSLREKLNQALDEIESQLLIRGIVRERREIDAPIATV